MKILKASAGSGKTYSLSHTYIDILLNSDDRYAYRHLLAVTFTNKATAEMKGRILKDLYELATKKNNRKAAQILTDILHDYSAFAVSTIDKFFQRALKAFSREAGHFAAYQIELDRNSVIRESVDRILDSLTEETKELNAWIKKAVNEQLAAGEKADVETALYEMCAELKSEEHRKAVELHKIDESKAFDKTRLDSLGKDCDNIIKDFREKCKALDWDPDKKPGVRARQNNAALDELFDKSYPLYATALLIKKQLFSLGIAGEFYREFDALLKEKNLMCLDESNVILRDIIDGSDAPFVYEKLGVRFEKFLLDEFQDTSEIQWNNFLPLLKESESNCPADKPNLGNLIVGDVKQSIYRWRDSDWTLLGKRVGEEFPEAEVETMEDNWRSTRSVVNFNNEFFGYLAANTGNAEIYRDVQQNVKNEDPQSGQVKVSFCDDQYLRTLESIRDAREQGARWNDIAILVRDNLSGSRIAAALIPAGIPVISDEALLLNSALTVRRLVSLLSCIDNPNDTINGYLASSLSVTIPQSYHSLTDLCEELTRELIKTDRQTVENETAFVEAFMDLLQDWTGVNGNNLNEFLQYWDGEKDKICIGSPETADAVRILTIHKSKGLEFNHLIFPFAEKLKPKSGSTCWCRLKAEGSGFSQSADGIYPVALDNGSADTLFSDYYNEEMAMERTDNVNLFYVALTRASKTLHVIASPPTKKHLESKGKGSVHYSNYSEYLYDFCGGMSEFIKGEPYDFRIMKRDDKGVAQNKPFVYDSIALNPVGKDGETIMRLRPSDKASDFFGEEGKTGIEASSRLRGIVLHGILSEIDAADQLPEAVKAAKDSGALNQDQADEALTLLKERLDSHPEWFSGNGRNEFTIFDSEGEDNRPDRVVSTSDGTLVIIDYKFGEHKKGHFFQVRRYMNLFKEMGYGKIKGYVWYIPEDSLTEVSL